MNMILYNKVKRDLKDINEKKIKKTVIKTQRRFGIKDNSNVFEIEQRIDDNNYSKIIKKQKHIYNNNIDKKIYHKIRKRVILWWMSEDC